MGKEADRERHPSEPVVLCALPSTTESPLSMSPSSRSSSVRMPTQRALLEIGRFRIGCRTLGVGTFAKVQLGCYIDDPNTKVAVKILKREVVDMDPKKHEQLEREVAILRSLDHPNIIKLLDYLSDDYHYFLVFEYAPHCLSDLLYGKRNNDGTLMRYLTHHSSQRLMRQLGEALAYLHEEKRIVHLDLKPENILLDANLHLKLADFGFACGVEPGLRLSKWCGSPLTVAPQLLLRQPYDGPKADAWSCGVLLYACLCGRWPFESRDLRRLFDRIRRGTFDFPAEVPVSASAKELIEWLLTYDEATRPTVAEALKHRFFTENYKAAAASPSREHVATCAPCHASSPPDDSTLLHRPALASPAREE